MHPEGTGIMGLLIGILIAALLVALYAIYDKRYHGRSNPRARPTGEVFRDPGSGEIMRVHEDPDTGEREYRREDRH